MSHFERLIWIVTKERAKVIIMLACDFLAAMTEFDNLRDITNDGNKPFLVNVMEKCCTTLFFTN
jgi:hypothetical protein